MLRFLFSIIFVFALAVLATPAPAAPTVLQVDETPTETSVIPTNTPTLTPSPTETNIPPVPPTATSTATNTSVPPVGLNAPTNLTARAVSTTVIDVVWTDNSANEDMFVVEYSMDGSTWYSLEPFGENETRFRFAGLTAGTTYHFRVKAVNEAGESAYSNVASATTFAPDVPTQTMTPVSPTATEPMVPPPSTPTLPVAEPTQTLSPIPSATMVPTPLPTGGVFPPVPPPFVEGLIYLPLVVNQPLIMTSPPPTGAPTDVPPAPTEPVAPTQVPSGIPVLSSSTYIARTGSRYIVGEVQNNTGRNVEFVKIVASLYDAGGTLVGSDFSYADLDILRPGQRSPFDLLIVNPPASFSYYTLQVEWRATDEQLLDGVTILSHSTRPASSSDRRYIFGEVRNDSGGPVKFVRISATMYDTGGTVVGVDFTYTRIDQLAAGQTSPFELLVDRWVNVARYELQVQARRP